MDVDSGRIDLSGFKKKVTCGGRQYDEFSNFYQCQIQTEEGCWSSSEHYYQALKFPGTDGAEIRDALRQACSPMESWQLGNTHKELLRKDWEVVKLDMMYEANYAKFSQSGVLRESLVSSRGPICCDGGIFWKTWNEVILERIREELKDNDQRNSVCLQKRVAMLQAYASAVSSGDKRLVEVVTQSASKRELPPDRGNEDTLLICGVGDLSAELFTWDAMKPEVNGEEHYVSQNGWHLYLGKKNGITAWVVDEACSPNEATGFAYKEANVTNTNLPTGNQQWQVWDHSLSRHVPTELVLRDA